MTQQLSDPAKAVIWLSLVVVGVSLLLYFFVGPQAFFEQREAAKDIQEETYDADNALDEYEWFKQQKEDIEAQRKIINNSIEEEQQFHETYGDDPREWSRTAETRHGRLHSRITGAQNIHEELVADYNARANQAHRAIFRCGLPYEMEKKFWLGDGRQANDKYTDDARQVAPEDPSKCTTINSTAINA